MGVTKYRNGDQTFWKADFRVNLPDGREKRIIKRKIPTKEMALALQAKCKAEAFEGRWFNTKRSRPVSVREVWDAYHPLSRQKKRSWQTDEGRAVHILKHLGGKLAEHLSFRDVDAYRQNRLLEKTRRNTSPTPATINREVAILRRILNYAVKCAVITVNPIAGVTMLDEDNVRQVTVSEKELQTLMLAAEVSFRPILLTAYDTGMRKEEILGLTWAQVDLKGRTFRLASQDTKNRHPRLIVLTERLENALREIPRSIGGHVFTNPKTGRRWVDIRKLYRRACDEANLSHVWFHDLRRSFVTNARRRGIPESVVMKMSGHRTRTVFERYNVIDDSDMRMAIGLLEKGCQADLENDGKVLDHPARGESKTKKALPA